MFQGMHLPFPLKNRKGVPKGGASAGDVIWRKDSRFLLWVSQTPGDGPAPMCLWAALNEQSEIFKKIIS